jgi:2-C-methyl-D-erythritol 4-phosphate cytidylyltransferase
MQDISVIIPAAGSGTRMGGSVPKPYVRIAGLPVLSHTLRCFDYPDRIACIILAVSEDCKAQAREAVRLSGIAIPVKVVLGGAERLDSIQNALVHIADETRLVAVHDAVRPFVDEDLLMRVIHSAGQTGASIPGLLVTDTIKEVNLQGLVIQTPDRSSLRSVQTPQIFHRDILLRAYEHAKKHGLRATDDASLVELIGQGVTVVEGNPNNIKLTYPQDLQKARNIIKNRLKNT